MDPNHAARAITITPKPEHFEEALADAAKFAKLIEENEPDCLMYRISRAKPLTGDGPEQIIMALVFKDAAALKAHEENPKLVAHREEKKKLGILAGPPDVKVVTPIGGFSRIG